MKRVMKGFVVMGLAAAVGGLCGCVPQRVVWSPDGTRAAVIGGDGLHVCDVSGKVGATLVPEVERAAWLPDGKRVVVVRQQHEKTAKDVEKVYPEAERRAKELMAALKSSGGDAEKAKDALHWSGPELSAALIVLRDDVTSGLAATYPDTAQAAADRTYDELVGEVYTINGEKAEPGQVLLQVPGEQMVEERVSPDGKLVAFTIEPTQGSNGGDRCMVGVTAVDGAGDDDDLVMLGVGCESVDWTADSRSLLYERPVSRPESAGDANGGDAGFATLVKQAVCGADGKLLAHGDLPKAEELVGMVYSAQSRVRVAPDGRVYFTTMDVALPATPNDLDTTQVLFSIMPGKEATVSRVIPRGARGEAGDAMEWFELSPDAKRIAVPFKDGRVSVVTLATGDVEVVQPTASAKRDSIELQSLPAWRGSGELTFLRPVSGGVGLEVVRHTLADKTDVVISDKWGDDVRQGWLDHDVGGN